MEATPSFCSLFYPIQVKVQLSMGTLSRGLKYFVLNALLPVCITEDFWSLEKGEGCFVLSESGDNTLCGEQGGVLNPQGGLTGPHETKCLL